MCFQVSAKIKRDGWTDERTDRQTEGGISIYLPFRSFDAAADNNTVKTFLGIKV